MNVQHLPRFSELLILVVNALLHTGRFLIYLSRSLAEVAFQRHFLLNDLAGV